MVFDQNLDMEASQSARLDKWRDFFQTANSDIFDIVEQAIMVAASDCPKEFRIRRDRIAQTLFSCKLITCSGCDNKVELALASNNDDDGEFCKLSKIDRDAGCELEVDGSKGSKVNSTSSGRNDATEINLTPVSNIYSHGEDEVLTDEESRIYGEVLRIKKILDNSTQDENSCLVLNDTLRRLQVMGLSVKTLKDTQIGKSVNSLRRKHALNPDICHLARKLIHGWRVTVDEWVNATRTTTISETTPPSVNHNHLLNEEKKDEQMKKQSIAESAGVRCTKPPMEEKVNNGIKIQQKSAKASTIPKRPEECEATKFEAAKRKLQGSYQQVENAKRQRRAQVIQLHDIPKQSLEGHKIAHMKPAGNNHKSHWGIRSSLAIKHNFSDINFLI